MDGTSESLLRNAHFLRLWIGQGISFVGDFVSTVALVVFVVELSGSASAVGGLLVVRLIPTLASPLVGVLADRLDRRVVLVASDLARAILITGVIFVQDLALLYILVFLMGLARTFFNPTIRAAFPTIVREGDLTRANSLISGTFSVSVAVGPALGGLLVATSGVEAAFLLDALTYLASAVFLFRIPFPRPQVSEEGGFIPELRAGFGYLARARIPLAIVVGGFLATLTANASVPAEVFLAKVTFGAGDAGYGLLVSLLGGGMILGSGLTAVLGDRLNLVALYLLSIVLTALALAAVGFSPTFLLALISVTVVGISYGMDNVATDTVLQRRVPGAVLGRVFATRFLAYNIGDVLAYAVGGLVVDAVGPRATYLLAGGTTAAAGLLVLLIIVVAPRKKV